MDMITDGEFALPSSLLGKTAKHGNADRDLMCSYINALEGYKTKFKNLHWSANNDALHLRVDEFSDALSGYQDAVSEDIQGTIGAFSPSELKGIEIATNDAMSTIKLLHKDNSPVPIFFLLFLFQIFFDLLHLFRYMSIF